MTGQISLIIGFRPILSLFFSPALKQDFAVIKGGWNTATQLGMILCQSCVGLKLPEIKEYEESFLPDVVDNVLTLAAKLLDFSVKAIDVRFGRFKYSYFFDNSTSNYM